MNFEEFLEKFANIRLSGAQRLLMNAVTAGKIKVIGYDMGSPSGDKSCKIYGKISNGQIIIDDIETTEQKGE